MDNNGLITILSTFSVRETIDRLSEKAASLDLTVFARVDHAAGAEKAGIKMRPTEVIIFGNPKGGTPLMQDRQTAGIDLPLKALAWEDADGKVWLTYNDAHWIADRHGLGPQQRRRSQSNRRGHGSHHQVRCGRLNFRRTRPAPRSCSQSGLSK